MPFFKIGRKTSGTKIQSNEKPPEKSPSPKSSNQLLQGSSAEIREQSTTRKSGSPKTVRIDEGSLSRNTSRDQLKNASTEDVRNRRKARAPSTIDEMEISAGSSKDVGESLLLRSEVSVTDTASDGYQSSRESIRSPSTPATSVGSASYAPAPRREIAHGFETMVAKLPPPPPRTPSSVKLTLGHGKDGSRPMFRVSSPPKGKSGRSSRSPQKEKNNEKPDSQG